MLWSNVAVIALRRVLCRAKDNIHIFRCFCPPPLKHCASQSRPPPNAHSLYETLEVFVSAARMKNCGSAPLRGYIYA